MGSNLTSSSWTIEISSSGARNNPFLKANIRRATRETHRPLQNRKHVLKTSLYITIYVTLFTQVYVMTNPCLSNTLRPIRPLRIGEP